mmetsp:Transcript_12169/g.22625  ORF Transcript_12169/g.22625 Transcript_12169/m.22625 type:complete len:219 (-) Transcript_12169:1675-2331(-)
MNVASFCHVLQSRRLLLISNIYRWLLPTVSERQMQWTTPTMRMPFGMFSTRQPATLKRARIIPGDRPETDKPEKTLRNRGAGIKEGTTLAPAVPKAKLLYWPSLKNRGKRTENKPRHFAKRWKWFASNLIAFGRLYRVSHIRCKTMAKPGEKLGMWSLHIRFQPKTIRNLTMISLFCVPKISSTRTGASASIATKDGRRLKGAVVVSHQPMLLFMMTS